MSSDRRIAEQEEPPQALFGPLLLLGAVTVAAYWPELHGGWVWDDRYHVADPAAFRDLVALLTEDPWTATGHSKSDLYRPLHLLSHAPGQLLWPGPLVERLLALFLHLLNIVLVASICRGIGLGTRAVVFGAALFALHPLASESVSWISARPSLLMTSAVLLATAAIVNGRERWAIAPLVLAPFAWEPGIFLPATVLLLGLGLGRRLPTALLATAAGTALYLTARQIFDHPFPLSSGLNDPVAALGGTTGRALQVLLDPTASDAFAPYFGSVGLGVLGAAAGLGLIVLARGRAPLGILAGFAVLVATSAPAAATNGIFGDRYFYLLLAGVAVAGAGLLDALDRRSRQAALLLGILIPLALAPFTWLRAHDWVSDTALANASLGRDAANPYAAFHRAGAHLRADDCEAAIPLYRLAVEVERRAANNLQVCLLRTGGLEEAAAMIPSLLGRDERAGPAYNSALVLWELQRLGEAELVVREALRRDPTHTEARVLPARLFLRGGLPAEALELLLQVERDAPDTDGLPRLISQARTMAEGAPPQAP